MKTVIAAALGECVHALARKKVADPLADPATLTQAVACGILDAPQLRNNPFAKGQIVTRIANGGCDAVGSDGKPISEADRLAEFMIGRVLQ